MVDLMILVSLVIRTRCHMIINIHVHGFFYFELNDLQSVELPALSSIKRGCIPIL